MRAGLRVRISPSTYNERGYDMSKKKLKKKIIRLKALNKDLKNHVCDLESQIHILSGDNFQNDYVRFYLKSMMSENPYVTVQEIIDSLNRQLGKRY